MLLNKKTQVFSENVEKCPLKKFKNFRFMLLFEDLISSILHSDFNTDSFSNVCIFKAKVLMLFSSFLFFFFLLFLEIVKGPQKI